jgi:hypothetical protein
VKYFQYQAGKHLDTREYKQQMEAVKNLQAQAAAESKNLRETREAIRHDEEGWHEKIREYEKIAQAAEQEKTPRFTLGR